MNRRLNGRLLLSLIAGGLILGGGVHVLHGMQVKRSATALLALANEAEREGRRDEAANYLARYLDFHPNDADVLVRYGQILDSQDDDATPRGQMIRIYERIIRLVPDRADIRRRLVELNLDEQQYSGAKLHADILARSDPEDSTSVFLLGRCVEGSGHYAEAAALYRESLDLSSPPIEVFTRLADLLRLRLDQAEEADTIMDAHEVRDGLIAAYPGSASAYLARSKYRSRYGIPGSEEDLARVLELDPRNTDALLLAAISAQSDAEVARSSGDFNRALVVIERAIEFLADPDGNVKDPKNPEFYLTLARLETLADRPHEAIKWLTRGLASLPEEIGLRFALAEAHIQLEDSAVALKLVEQLDRDGMSPGLVRYLHGRILMMKADWRGASAALEKAREEIGARSDALAKQINIILAQCYGNQGDFDRAHRAYRRAVDITLASDPLWATARLGLASTLVIQNRIEDAIREYRILRTRLPAAGLTLARVLIDRNLRSPEDRREWQEVEQALLAAEPAIPGDRKVELTILRADALKAQGRVQEARDLVEAAIADRGDQVDLWVALSNIELQDNRPEEALVVLDDAQERLGDRIELRLARIAHWAYCGGEAAQSNLEDLGAHLESLGLEDRVRIQRALATAYLRLGKLEEAKQRWDEVSREEPDDLDSHLVRLDLALQTGDESGASQVLEQIRTVEGRDGPTGNYGEARLLIRTMRDHSKPHGDALDRAERLLTRAAEERPVWSAVTVARAQVEELRGRPDQAIDLYLKAIFDQSNRNANTIYRVFALLHNRQRSQEAGALFRRLREEQIPLSTGLQQLVAQISTANRDYHQALELAQHAVSEDSENPAELIWLAEKRWAAGEDAEPLLRRAIDVNRQDPIGWIALVTYLARTDRRDSALEAIRSAEHALPDDAAAMTLARCYEEVGDTVLAREYYEDALPEPIQEARAEDFPTLRAVVTFYLRNDHRAEAEKLLERMISLGGTASDASWARRVKASILATGGNHGVIEALELLGSNDPAASAGDQTAPEDLRIKARILAIQPNRAHRGRAMDMLEKMVSDGVANTDDRFLLAQLREANGDWDQANSEIQALLERYPDSLGILAHYVRFLLRHGKPDIAHAHLDKIEAAVPPGQPLVVELRARTLHALGRDSEAVTLLRNYARTSEERLGGVAVLLEQLGEVAAAEEMMRQLVDRFRSEQPEVRLALATFLSRHGKAEEAIGELERAWETCAPEAVANTSVLVLYGTTRDDKQTERVAARIENAIQKSPDKVSILFDLANIRVLQGRYSDAKSIYQAIHERNKTDGAPLNNLAWMLALQGGRGAEALAYAQKAISLQGETPELLDTRALAYLASDQPGSAIQDLENALAVARDNVGMLFHLALAYHMAGNQEDAADTFRKAQDLGLTVINLHPLERKSFEQLSQHFNKK